MSKMIIPYTGYTEKQVEDTGLTTTMSHERIKKILTSTYIDLEEDEELTGCIIDKECITFKITNNQ